jgi:glycine hydroxymethyltransferase
LESPLQRLANAICSSFTFKHQDQFSQFRRRSNCANLFAEYHSPCSIIDYINSRIKIMSNQMKTALAQADLEIAEEILKETRRQHEGLEMIASENFVSRAVLEAAGSVFTNKYAEGYPAKRYYGGCEFADVVETIASDRAKKLFGAQHANVQPHSGSQANAAGYMAVIQPGETILGLDLAQGGHLTHGHKLSFSGQLYRVVSYGVTRDTEVIDYDQLEAIAEREKPKLMIGGGSAYPRILDFIRMRQIADKVGALLLVDMAHFAGLVAGGVHPSPIPHAHIVTTTTHKTLRGPRAGLILTQEKFAAAVDRSVFPGQQGGPMVHIIAAKAVAFREALEPAFAEYAQQVVINAKVLAESLQCEGYRIISGGTDTHLVLVDVFARGMLGSEAEYALGEAAITVNKNAIPYDTNPPLKPSGIRIGSPALTTRGMREAEMRLIGKWIAEALYHRNDRRALARIRSRVLELVEQFPLYGWLRQQESVPPVAPDH